MHFQALDSWRGIAALLVALYHLHVFGHFFELSFVRNAWLFVDFFFVLSGFVIAHAYADRLTNGEDLAIFAIRRFGRLWPLHVVTTLASIALIDVLKLGFGLLGLVRFEVPVFASQEPWTWGTVAANLLMLHGLGLPGADPLNAPSWSIATEFHVYFVFAIVCLFARTRLLGISLAIAALALIVILLNAHATLAVPPRLAIVRGLYGFFVGAVVWHAWRARSVPFRHMPQWEFAVVILMVVFASFAGATPLTLAAPLLFGLTVFVFAYEAGPISRLLKTGPLLWAGLCSYSIYMVHMPIYLTLERVVLLLERRLDLPLTKVMSAPWFDIPVPILTFGNMWLMDLVALLCLALVVLVASVTYLLVEHPARRYFGNLTTRRRVLVPSG
jgi:peptidoglycan/LPS O-acetylase OafA/YrhL